MVENIKRIQNSLKSNNIKLWVLVNSGNSDDIFTKYISNKIYTFSLCFVTERKTYILIHDLDKDNIKNLDELARNNIYIVVYKSKLDLSAKIEDIISDLGFINNISLSYSTKGDRDIDILGHGEFIEVTDMLKVPYIRYKKKLKISSAENVIYDLICEKTDKQIERITNVQKITHTILETAFKTAKIGMTEIDMQNHIIKLAKKTVKKHLNSEIISFSFAWDNCPFVLFGENLKKGGHTLPSDKKLERGNTLYADFGICLKYSDGEYVYSDIQRMGYVTKYGTKEVPHDVQHVFDTLKESVEKGLEIMKPAVIAHDVDEVVRKHITSNSYPSYNHATGHPVGLKVHDVGAIISSKNNKKANLQLVNNGIYTLEPRIAIENGGSIEEMIIVTEFGGKILGYEQDKLYVIK